MKILRVYPTLPPYPGGVEQHVVRLTEAQRSDGIDVTIMYTFGTSTHPSDVKISRTVNLHTLRPQFVRDLLFYFLAIMRLVWTRGKFDIVHVHGDWSAFFFGIVLSRVVGARVRVASVHDRLRTGRFWDAIYAAVLRGYDFCYSTGQMDAARLSRLRSTGTAWITSGLHPIFQESISASDTETDSTNCDVLTVASLTPRKRLDLVLKIAKLLPEFRFRIIGDGPEKDRLESLVRQEGIENVLLAGRLSVEQVRAEYLRSKLFLLTSNSEGTPTAVLEAMACGLPIVTSASNDFSDLLEDDETGYVVTSHKASDYAEAIGVILRQDTVRARMGRTNRSRSASFSWTKIASRISESMEHALRTRRDPISPLQRSR